MICFPLCLFLLSLNKYSYSVHQYSPTVYYLSIVSTQNNNDTNHVQPKHEDYLSIVDNADDSPFEEITLPWSFSFFGRSLNRLFANPNGALHASSVMPCQGNFFGIMNVCTVYNSYYGLIGGLLTDLDPSMSSLSNITVNYYDDHVTVKYSNIVYFSTHYNNSFRISIYNDSRVIVYYDKIFRGNNFPEEWFSGLRQPFSQSYVTYDSEQIITNSLWQTSIPGISPLPSQVQTNNKFIACPISTLWCLYPNKLYKPTNNSIIENDSFITLTPLSISCLDIINIFVNLSHSSYNDNMIINCSYIIILNNDDSNLINKIQCKIPIFSMPDGNWTIEIMWNEQNSDNHTYKILPIQLLYLEIVSINNTNYESNNNNVCILNQSNITQSSCDICSGNFSSLQLECAHLSNSSTNINGYDNNDIYRRKSCKNLCLVDDVYLNDTTGTCCAYYDMDCSGKCFGSDHVSYSNAKHTLYCCPGVDDCLGICNGHSNKCPTKPPSFSPTGSPTFTPSNPSNEPSAHPTNPTNSPTAIPTITVTAQPTCISGICYDPHRVIVYTGETDSSIRPRFNLSIINNYKVLTNTFHIEIVNNNNVAITMSIDEDILYTNYFPFLTIVPSETINMIPGMKIMIEINASINDFKNNNQSTILWKPKVNVYSSTIGCNVLTSFSDCMRYPACLQSDDRNSHLQSGVCVDGFDYDN
eukprot:gene5093-7101_t